jgi:type IV secretory pathway VirJ component
MRTRAAIALLAAFAIGPARAHASAAADSTGADPVSVEQATGVGGLPLIELAPRRDGGDLFAIVLSGDGGWAGIDQAVAGQFSSHGVPVVGWDSLRYFWDARTPEGAAQDLERVIRHYAHAWGKSRVVLVGYSQGADTLPFMINRLSAGVRRLVAGTALIAVGPEAFFEFHLSHWFGTPTGGRPVAPEIEGGHLGPVLCLYGRDDGDSLCSEFRYPGLRAVALPGGHHFDGDYAAVAKAVLSGLIS